MTDIMTDSSLCAAMSHDKAQHQPVHHVRVQSSFCKQIRGQFVTQSLTQWCNTVLSVCSPCHLLFTVERGWRHKDQSRGCEGEGMLRVYRRVNMLLLKSMLLLDLFIFDLLISKQKNTQHMTTTIMWIIKEITKLLYHSKW